MKTILSSRYICSSPPPVMPEENKAPLFEWPRIIAVVGLVIATVVVLEVVHRQKHDDARRELSTEGRLLLSLADTDTGLMDVRALTNTISFASKEACEILGYGEGALSGRSINEILPMDFAQLHQQRVRETMQRVADGSDSQVSFMDCVAVGKDGGEIPVKVCVFVSRNGIIALLNRQEDIHQFPIQQDAR